jgi:hypothetical protein
VKKLPEEQNNSRKDAKAQRVAKQTKEFPFALLCVLAPLREIVLFFTASDPDGSGKTARATPRRMTIVAMTDHRAANEN